MALLQEHPQADLSSLKGSCEHFWAHIMSLAQQHPDCPEPVADKPAAVEALRSCCQSIAGPYTQLVMQLEIMVNRRCCCRLHAQC